MVKLVYDFRVREMLHHALGARDNLIDFLGRHPSGPDRHILYTALSYQDGLIKEMIRSFVSDATVEQIARDSVRVSFTPDQVADMEAA